MPAGAPGSSVTLAKFVGICFVKILRVVANPSVVETLPKFGAAGYGKKRQARQNAAFLNPTFICLSFFCIWCTIQVMSLQKRLTIFVAAAAVLNIVFGLIFFFTVPEVVVLPIGNFEYAHIHPGNNVHGAVSINGGMTAEEMFLTGVCNFSSVNFAAAEQIGSVEGTVVIIPGILSVPFSNVLTSTRIRDGQDAYWRTVTLGNNNPPAPNINVLEEALLSNGLFYYQRTDNAPRPPYQGAQIPQPENFDIRLSGLDRDAYFARMGATDPARISMHDFTPDTIRATSAPVHDAQARTFTYTVEMSEEKGGLEAYRDTVRSTMTADMQESAITFNRISLTVVQWDNGLIKSIEWNEEYHVDFLSGVNITMNAETVFSYNPNEPDFRLNDRRGFFAA